jgi:hypothetical protein
MATILKYSKGQTKCAGGSFEIIKLANGKFQAVDSITGLNVGGQESKKAYADINIVNACKNAGLPFTRENTNFTN